MDSPYPFSTVEPYFIGSCRSRPGPGFEHGDGAVQPVSSGKYVNSPISTTPDSLFGFSTIPFNRQPSSFSTKRVSTPGRNKPAVPGNVMSNCYAGGFDCSRTMTTISVSNGVPQPDHSSLSIYYQNVRGLRTKTTQLKLKLSCCDYDIIVFTETWLKSDICNTELTSDYTVFRCDRNEATSNHSRGGGVLVAVKPTLHCTAVSIVDCNQLEQVAVKILLPHRSLFISAVYIPPGSGVGLYSAHAVTAQYLLDRSSPNDVIVLIGDYNLPHLQWCFEEDINGYLPSNASSEQETNLADPISSCGLVQVNSHVNSNNRLLDLAFTSSPDITEVFQPPLPLLPIDAHHPPFILLVDLQSSVTCHQIFPASNENDMDFRRCNFDSLNVAFSSIDWQHFLNKRSVDANVFLFYDKLNEIIRSNVPRRRRNLSSVSRKPWWTAELRNLRNRLRKARKRFFALRSDVNRDWLRQIESSYNELHTSSYQQYICRLESNLKQNPSMFWRYVKGQRATNLVPINVVYNDSTASTADEPANLFSDFFQSVFCLSVELIMAI
ncbi:uncharacterized protein LOC129772887 [Toxorhynchites rutilus septentrionalis]|uniref:uncharacterized protein LOC129772887 n=1 Tax=Toxorhynchites rutilus septentrionalis TaxID=329112 RepID=UPI002479E786|nr:uncharacterized protein LOC129772887 [Toxorhynchites rutilus septentrionalis]